MRFLRRTARISEQVLTNLAALVLANEISVSTPPRQRGRGGRAKYWLFGTFGAMFERKGTAKSCFLPLYRSFTTMIQGRLRLVMSSRSSPHRSKNSCEMETIFNLCPFLQVGARRNASPLQVADILRFTAPRQPRRLYVQVSRILCAAASDALSISRFHIRSLYCIVASRFWTQKDDFDSETL